MKEWVWEQSAKRHGEAPGGEVAASASVPWERSQCHVHKGHGELKYRSGKRRESQGAHWEAPTWWEGLKEVRSHLHRGFGSGSQQAGDGGLGEDSL